jgi:hypothetical protein
MPGFTSIINDTQWSAGVNQSQGTITDGVSNSALTVGQLVYYNPGSNQWGLADAISIAFAAKTLGVVLNTVGAAANDISVLLDGIYSTQFQNGIAATGDLVYISQTAGNVAGTPPTAAGTIIRGVGQTLGIGIGGWYAINFRPDTTYFTNG